MADSVELNNWTKWLPPLLLMSGMVGGGVAWVNDSISDTERRLDARIDDLDKRMIAVEFTLDNLTDGLKSIDSKLDEAIARPR